MTIPFGRAELMQLTQEIWTEMLGIPIEPLPLTQESTAPKTSSVLAFVHIAGAWEGAVLLNCSPKLARRVAAAFLSMAEEAVSCDQVRDAIGEVANMSAGRLKPLVPGPSHISLPSVAEGIDYRLTIPKGCVAAQTHFLSDGEGVVLSVIESQEQPGQNKDSAKLV